MLRGHDLLQIEHNVDHAYPVWQALQTIDHGVFPLVGQGTSVLFANPALTGYLFLPMVALTRSPLGAYLLVISLNTLAVLLAFRAARRLLGVPVALAAALLLAVNPWVIEYSRTSWVQSLLPFFACALAWLLWPVLLGQSRHPARRLIAAFVVLALYTQTYLLAFLTLAPVGLLLVIFRRRIPPRALVIGGGIFVVAGLVYGLGLLGQLNTVQSRLGEFSSNTPRLSGEAWGHAVRLVTGEDYELARGQNAPIHDAPLRHDLTRIAHILLALALLIGLLLALLSILRRFFPAFSPFSFLFSPSLLSTQHTALSTVLLLWFSLPILLMSYVGQPVHPFYQLLGLPAGHILAAWGLCAVFRADTRVEKWALVTLSIPFAALMAVNSSRYYQETAAFPGEHGLTALSLEYGLPLGQAIDQHLPSGGVVYADIEDWILNSFAGQTFAVIRDVRPNVQIIPASGGLVVQMQPNAIGAVSNANRVETLELPDGWVIAVDQYAPATLPDISQPLNVTSEQGLTLLGYDLSQTGDMADLSTYWRVDASLAANSLFAPFAHIFDTDGTRALIVDGDVLPGERWQVDDIHVHRMQFTLPDTGAPFTLQIGQYDSQHSQNLIFLPDYTPSVSLAERLNP